MKKKRKTTPNVQTTKEVQTESSAPSGTVATVAAIAATLDWRAGGGGGCLADGGGCASLSTRAALETT